MRSYKTWNYAGLVPFDKLVPKTILLLIYTKTHFPFLGVAWREKKRHTSGTFSTHTQALLETMELMMCNEYNLLSFVFKKINKTSWRNYIFIDLVNAQLFFT